MARQARPVRRVRGADRERLCATLGAIVGYRPGLRLWRGLSLRYAADKLVCRPSQLRRRCLLGLPVSARAAARILSRAA